MTQRKEREVLGSYLSDCEQGLGRIIPNHRQDAEANRLQQVRSLGFCALRGLRLILLFR